MKIVLVLLLLPASAFAGTYEYDWKSGNSYWTQPNANGGATVRGYNFKESSSWSTTIDQNGNQRGWDANGNYWQYNNRSGAYFNYGTGKNCFGTGAGRVCN